MTIARSIARSIARPIARGVGEGVGTTDPILALFANGEQGAYISAWNLASLSLNPDGSGSVSADDDLVGKMADQDGQTDNSVTQSTTARKPKIQTDASGFRYILWDGADDFLQSAAGVFGASETELWFAAAAGAASSSDTVVAGVSNVAYGGAQEWATLSTRIAGVTRFALNKPGTQTVASVPAIGSDPAILHGYWDGSDVYLRVNGAASASSATTISTIDVSQELDVGAVDNGGSIVLNSPLELYGLIVRNKAPSAAEIELVDTEFAKHCPVTLP